jgi:hypothetical protein
MTTKPQITYKGKPMKITAGFPIETIKGEGNGVRYSGHRIKISSTLAY